jgi:hypothetical protein
VLRHYLVQVARPRLAEAFANLGCLSVDFAAANPASRPFWLAAGFQPTGYGLLRRGEQHQVCSR